MIHQFFPRWGDIWLSVKRRLCINCTDPKEDTRSLLCRGTHRPCCWLKTTCCVKYKLPKGISPSRCAMYSSFSTEVFCTIFTSSIAITGTSDIIMRRREFAILQSMLFTANFIWSPEYSYISNDIAPFIFIYTYFKLLIKSIFIIF